MGDVAFSPSLVRSGDDGRGLIRIGHPLLDAYLELVAARGRPNTLLAHAYDLKVFFTVIDRDPVDVAPVDVLAFIAEQRQPRRASNVVRIEDGEVGLSARTIKRRLATIAGLYDYLSKPVAERLTSTMFAALRPHGTLLLANFLPDIPDVGYMESFMDWHLIYRTDQDMLDLIDALPRADVACVRQFRDSQNTITFLEVTKRP